MSYNDASNRVVELHRQYMAFGDQNPPPETLNELKDNILEADGLHSAVEHSLYGQICLELAMSPDDTLDKQALLTSSEQCLQQAVANSDLQRVHTADMLLAYLPKYATYALEGRQPDLEHEEQALASLRGTLGRLAIAYYCTPGVAQNERQELACHIAFSRYNLRSGELLVSAWPAFDRQRTARWDTAANTKGFWLPGARKFDTRGRARGRKSPPLKIEQAQVINSRGSDMSTAFLLMIREEETLRQEMTNPAHDLRTRERLADRSEQLDMLSSRLLRKVGVTISPKKAGE